MTVKEAISTMMGVDRLIDQLENLQEKKMDTLHPEEIEIIESIIDLLGDYKNLLNGLLDKIEIDC